MTKITLNNVGSLVDYTTAGTTINNNFDTIETAFDNTLSRDGTSPNTMGNNFDMNSYQIYNLPAPATVNSPLRLQDLNTFIGGGTITSIPAGGVANDFLIKSSATDYAVTWGTNLPANHGGTGFTAYTIGDLLYANSATTLAKLADVATNNALISGGVGVAPSWGKISNSHLTNSSVTYGTSTVALGGSTTTLSGLQQINMTGTNPGLLLNGFGVGGYPQFQLQSARGTSGSATAVQANDYMFVLNGYGYTGSAYKQSGAIFSQATETFINGTNSGTSLEFYATPTGTNNLAEVFRVNAGMSVGTTTDNGAGTITTSGAIFTTAHTITSASATALAIGLNGSTNPSFQVDSSVGSQVAGLKITGAVTGGTVAIVAIDSGSNTNLTINAKGTGTIGIGSVSTGAVTITPATTVTGALSGSSSIKSSSATAGIGYATGAGSTVSQGTSRTTGVTINAASGAITLFSQVNSAVSGATAQTFVVTNSAVVATDTIIVNQKSGTDKYLTFVTNVGAGVFSITNYTTGGTTNEAPVFTFIVIKGVTS